MSANQNSALTKKYIRVRNRTAKGFVEFDFSIDDPELYVELILPETAFKEFCEHNAVEWLSPEEGKRLDADRKKWRTSVS
ncbi:MAG: phenol hydroxylase [Candidatus Competibacteraceae bacterium]|nr:phenol hydroxylase [Candidatus Competibacteraceae bacterium]MCB1810621.1 phenol hydroxylase [Candidatus Competibacteraceae bacterium]